MEEASSTLQTGGTSSYRPWIPAPRAAEPLQRRESWGCPWRYAIDATPPLSNMAKALALLAVAARGAAASCPAGPDEAPRTALTVKFPRYSCETVRNEFKARMAMDPSYRVTAEASDSLAASRTTDATHDVFAFAYEATVQDERQGSPKALVPCCVVSCVEISQCVGCTGSVER